MDKAEVQAFVVSITEGRTDLCLPALDALRRLRSITDFVQAFFLLSKKLPLCNRGRWSFLVREIVGSETGV